MKISHQISLPLAALTALLACSPSAFAQSILGTAGDFALLAGHSITTTGPTGPTIENGDVGSYTITGPMQITNGTQVTTDPTLSNALGDLTKSMNGLAGMPSDHNLSTVDLGGTTLLPGVYTFNSAANQALSTNLTLDANGQNHVFWVFQIGSSITFGANDNILMTDTGTNGGSDDGIFWVAETGAVTFGANDHILGNFLAFTDIIFGSTDVFNGTALAKVDITSLDLTTTANVQGGPPAGNVWAGGLKYDPNNNTSVIPVPEPSAFLWLAPLGAMGVALWRKRFAANIIAA